MAARMSAPQLTSPSPPLSAASSTSRPSLSPLPPPLHAHCNRQTVPQLHSDRPRHASLRSRAAASLANGLKRISSAASTVPVLPALPSFHTLHFSQFVPPLPPSPPFFPHDSYSDGSSPGSLPAKSESCQSWSIKGAPQGQVLVSSSRPRNYRSTPLPGPASSRRLSPALASSERSDPQAVGRDSSTTVSLSRFPRPPRLVEHPPPLCQHASISPQGPKSPSPQLFYPTPSSYVCHFSFSVASLDTPPATPVELCRTDAVPVAVSRDTRVLDAFTWGVGDGTPDTRDIVACSYAHATKMAPKQGKKYRDLQSAYQHIKNQGDSSTASSLDTQLPAPYSPWEGGSRAMTPMDHHLAPSPLRIAKSQSRLSSSIQGLKRSFTRRRDKKDDVEAQELRDLPSFSGGGDAVPYTIQEAPVGEHDDQLEVGSRPRGDGDNASLGGSSVYTGYDYTQSIAPDRRSNPFALDQALSQLGLDGPPPVSSVDDAAGCDNIRASLYLPSGPARQSLMGPDSRRASQLSPAGAHAHVSQGSTGEMYPDGAAHPNDTLTNLIGRYQVNNTEVNDGGFRTFPNVSPKANFGGGNGPSPRPVTRTVSVGRPKFFFDDGVHPQGSRAMAPLHCFEGSSGSDVDTRKVLRLSDPFSDISEAPLEHLGGGILPSVAAQAGPSSSRLHPATTGTSLDAAAATGKPASKPSAGKADLMGIPKIWNRQSSGDFSKCSKASTKKDSLESTPIGATHAAEGEDDDLDWVTDRGQSSQDVGRPSLDDSVANYSSSSGSDIHPLSMVEEETSRERLATSVAGHESQQLFSTPSLPALNGRAVAVPEHALMSPMGQRSSSTVSRFTGRGMSTRPSAATVQRPLGASLNDEGTMTALLAAGPNDDILYERQSHSTPPDSLHVEPPTMSTLASHDSHASDEDGSLPKPAPRNHMRNITGTPGGTGTRLVGSSVADSSTLGMMTFQRTPEHPTPDEILSPQRDRFPVQTPSPLSRFIHSTSVVQVPSPTWQTATPVTRPERPRVHTYSLSAYNSPSSGQSSTPVSQTGSQYRLHNGSASQVGSPFQMSSPLGTPSPVRCPSPSLQSSPPPTMAIFRGREARPATAGSHPSTLSSRTRSAVASQTQLRQMVLPDGRTATSSETHIDRVSSYNTISPLRQQNDRSPLQAHANLVSEDSPHLLIPERDVPLHAYQRQHAVGAVSCAIGVCFPPLLLVFALGCMDPLVAYWTRGLVTECNSTHKRIACVVASTELAAVLTALIAVFVIMGTSGKL